MSQVYVNKIINLNLPVEISMLNKYIARVVISSMSFLSFSAIAYDYGNYGGYDDDSYYESSYHSGNSRQISHHASLPTKISSGNMIKVDLGRLVWGAYDHQGYLVKSGHVSGGKEYCPDIGRRCRTVTGTYTIYSKKGADCKSTRFPVGRGGAPMPYCMFFHGGYALHGSNAVPWHNASHGCVRMHPQDAQWLNQNFVRVGSTRVSIKY